MTTTMSYTASSQVCSRVRSEWSGAIPGCAKLQADPLIDDDDDFSFSLPARENSSNCIANIVGHWWFGSQYPSSARTYVEKIQEADEVITKEKQRRKADPNYIPNEYLVERDSLLRQLYMHLQCPHSLRCFGRYLTTQLDAGISRMDLVHMRDVQAAWSEETGRVQLEKGYLGLPIYFTSVIVATLPLIGPDLRTQLKRYANFHDASLLRGWTDRVTPSEDAHCVIHYRVGDFLTLVNQDGLIISPASVAAAAASFRPRPTTIEVLDGGIGWNSSIGVDSEASSTIDRSLEALYNLSLALKAALLAAWLPPSTLRSPDEDLYIMANAPMLVTAGGSFGLVGAIGGAAGQQVRSPATDHHMDISGSSRRKVGRSLRKGWSEYVYKLTAPRTPSPRLPDEPPAYAVWQVASGAGRRLRYVLSGPDGSGGEAFDRPAEGARRMESSPWYHYSTSGANEWEAWSARRKAEDVASGMAMSTVLRIERS